MSAILHRMTVLTTPQILSATRELGDAKDALAVARKKSDQKAELLERVC
jgi:hypothetical protein